MSNFYSSTNDDKLRFGDVIQGSIFLTPKIYNLNENYYKDFDIKFENIDYAVIVTPCCTIQKSNRTREKFISITPLLHIYSSFLQNEYFSQDLTLINIHFYLYPELAELLQFEFSVEDFLQPSAYDRDAPGWHPPL